MSLRGGRFILPIGLAPREVGAATAKDMARITRLNAEANFGAMVAFSARRGDRPVFDVGVMAVLGDGNREKDYDWFYFVNTSLDTNSAVTVAASARARADQGPRSARRLQEGLHRLEGRAPAELLGVEAERRCAGGELEGVAGVVGLGVRRIREVQVGADVHVGRAGRHSRRSADRQAGLLHGRAVRSAGHARRVRFGGSVTREELTRDDSLIQYLDAQSACTA